MKSTAWRRGNWLSTLSMTAITALFLFVFFLPEMKIIRQARDEIRLKSEFCAQEPLLITQWEATCKDRDETAAFIQGWTRQAPSRGEVSRLYSRISQLADASETSITRFEPGAPVEYQQFMQLPLSLSVEGTFASCSSLVAQIEGQPETIWVQQVKLERSAEAGETLRCDLNLAIFAGKAEISD